jgi:hypothetical protein
LDNLWRGLPEAEQEVVRSAVTALSHGGQVTSVASQHGVQISVHPKAVDDLRRFVAGTHDPAALTAVWKR